MYIRKTKTRAVNGKAYYSCRLVETERRADGKVKQTTLLNLGSDYKAVAADDWLPLANRISNIIYGVQEMFPLKDDLENEAQRLAALIIKKHGEELVVDSSKHNYAEVDIDSLINSDAISVGAESLIYETVKKLELPELFMEVGLNGQQINSALASIIGRLLKPGSESALCRYLRKDSALDEIIGTDFSKLHKNKLYGISDVLWKHKELIEQRLYAREQELFKFDEIITLYDLTNTYFEGDAKLNENAAFGRSKERRSDCLLVTLALVLDGSGFPKKSQIFKGNVSEASTLEKMLELVSKEAVVVMDAGIATEDNIKWLTDNGYKYLVASRKRAQKLPENIDGVVVKEDKANKVTAYLVKDDDGVEAELYCHSEGMEKHNSKLQSKFRDKFENELQKLSCGLSKKGCTKKYQKVLEKLGRLKERYSKVSGLYKVEVTADNEQALATKITWQHTPEKQTKPLGVYCLRTNQTDLSHTEIWKVYRMLNDLESAFRVMKTDLGLRPIYHQKTIRVSGHIFISLLAYHILHTIRYQLKDRDINDSWATILGKLNGHLRITTSLKKKNGKTMHVRKSMRPTPEQQEIYRVCGTPLVPLKTIISEY